MYVYTCMCVCQVMCSRCSNVTHPPPYSAGTQTHQKSHIHAHKQTHTHTREWMGGVPTPPIHLVA